MQKAIEKKIKELKPGEAIHIGHSYLILNIAGIIFVLDPATEDGYCTAPFCNLLPYSKARVDILEPLIDISEVVPDPKKIAKFVDVIVYSHLHSDHFVGSILKCFVDANPEIKVVLPAGAVAVISNRPQKSKSLFSSLIDKLSERNLFDGYVDGIQEYLSAKDFLDLNPSQIIELENDAEFTIPKNPMIKIRAFEVRHPKQQIYVKLPFEASYSPKVLGYEITYFEGENKKTILLIGETGTNPEILWRIWDNRRQLTGLFLPVADEVEIKGLKLIKDMYIHASLQIIPIAERLSGKNTTIHCLHQGLWYYILDEERVRVVRDKFSDGNKNVSAVTFESQLSNLRNNRKKSIFEFIQHLDIIGKIKDLNLEGGDKLRLNLPGTVFSYGIEETQTTSTEEPNI